MFRADVQRTGVYPGTDIGEMVDLKWKFETGTPAGPV